MNKQDYNELRETSWHRKLAPAEEARLQKHLAAQPGDREDWLTDTALSELLEKLPAAPVVATNFTACVLQAVALEAAAEKRANASGWTVFRRRWGWLPKSAGVGLIVALAMVSYHQHTVRARVDLAKNVAELSAVVSVSDAELVRDFEPISRLDDGEPKADTELLVLMK